MTDFQAFGAVNGGNGMNGPTTTVAPFSQWMQPGVRFKVTTTGISLKGYGVWRPNDGIQAAATEFALWQVNSASAGTFISGSHITGVTATAGAWTYATLGTPIALTSGQTYMIVALVGNTGFVEVDHIYGSTAPATLKAGLVNGPLTIFSDATTAGGTNSDPFNSTQGVFHDLPGATPIDITTSFPVQSSSASYWSGIDAIVTDAGSGATVTVPAAALTVAAPTPAIAAGAAVTVPAAALTIAAPTPAVAAGAGVTVPAAALTIAAPTPSIAHGASVTVPAAQITLAAPTPTIVTQGGVVVPAASLLIAAPTPTISVGASVHPPAAALTLAAPTPTVHAGAFPPVFDATLLSGTARMLRSYSGRASDSRNYSGRVSDSRNYSGEAA